MDEIDRAIDSAAQATVRVAQIPIALAPHGRPAQLTVPLDVDATERAHLAAWILTTLEGYLAAASGTPIITPQGPKVLRRDGLT